jgi:hypothetical protein
MARGSNGNLASILAQRFGWELHDQAIALQLPNLSGWLPSSWLAPLGLDGNAMYLDLRQLLIAIFAACLVACAVGAAVNDRRNHPRFLAALVAPWMMMTRYQMWGAMISAILVGISTGFGLVNALFSLLAAGMIANQVLDDAPGRSPQLHQILSTLAPDDGWIMLCLAALVLYFAAVPGRVIGEPATAVAVHPPIDDPPVEEPDEEIDFVLPGELDDKPETEKSEAAASQVNV